MPESAIRHFFGIEGRPLLDPWLRFAPAIEAHHDREQARARTAELRSAIVIGLVLYNVYNVTSLVLLPDVFWLSVALRVAVVTPASLALAWVIGRTSPAWAERLILAGILNAYVVPVFLFWRTADPSGAFTFGEFSLTIVYANMLLALRFRHAAIFTAGALGVTALAVVAKDGLDPALRPAFLLQSATACLFSLHANYRTEGRRCRTYLAALGATLQADAAETARRQFHDLSRTDALTELPNRRHLSDILDRWLSDPRPVALMMVDIDHFKLYNDALGHPAGDDCLRRVAQVFAAAGGTEDRFCARFGGEEFAFALRGVTRLEAARFARRLLQAIERTGIPHPARPDGLGIVTISLGAMLKPEGASLSPAEALAAADRALYRAKSRGRNRFAIEGEEPEGFARIA
ncbi:GGDEF domain-containing protein [Methylobacterium oryzihabitans]|uniref:diguanylate cyclase n=1 Tax=Methylobacterium oryzihabitans TaxID=2499852 RepID=A0A3S2VFP9_9HYPH|nr:diguanylate cyclase [Methylobacterium oryzihabitans]RVU21910.1 sensor domain-containing diguanylate cyclase [Methylobacterium oryzihabitans]